MNKYLVLLLLGIGLLSACDNKYGSPPPPTDPTLTTIGIASTATHCKLPVALDQGWWFKSIEASFGLGRYDDPTRIVYPNRDTIKIDWAMVVRKSAEQVDILVDSNATDNTRIIAIHLQSYKGDQTFHIRQNPTRPN